MKEVTIFGTGNFVCRTAVTADVVRARYLVGQFRIFSVEEFFAIYASELLISIRIVCKFRVVLRVWNTEVCLFQVLHDRKLTRGVVLSFGADLYDFVFSFAFGLFLLFQDDV